MRLRAVVMCVVFLVVTGTAHADRALSVTDELGDWAIESHLRMGGRDIVRFTAPPLAPSSRQVTAAQYVLSVRVWPANGVYVGIEQGISGFDDADRAALDGLGGASAGATDLGLRAGFVRRPTVSLIVGGGMETTIPSGSAVHSSERFDVEGHAMVGLSFTPRWDFYCQLRGGTRTAPAGDPGAGSRVGFRAGLAYQRARFFVLFHGFDLEHFEDVRYRSSGTQGTIGWELTPGLSLSLVGGGSVQSRFQQDTAIEGAWVLSYVFYPTGRAQRLRVEDRRRGEGWFWNSGRNSWGTMP